METANICDLLPTYYSKIFPYQQMYKWLSYGNDENFTNREFSFVLPGDVYVRYQSFGNGDEFGKELCTGWKTPEKIDIGAVFNLKPKQSKGLPEFRPVQKEFVLDIDLTDYDDIRTCCSGASVCPKCWKFMVVAVEILDKALRDDFGFQHLLWVFSGRRGIHCWVCDEIARVLDSSGRSAIIEYLSVIHGGENQAKKVILDNIHPSIQRALTIIDDYFDIICLEEQGIFDNDKNLGILGRTPQEVELKRKVQAEQGTRRRWNEILSWVGAKNADKSIKKKPKLLEEIKLQFCYPRLDVNVSKGLNHLLKAPFCVHPKTGKICVPFDPSQIREFDISQVPTIAKVIEEMNQSSSTTDSGNKPIWEKTSVAPYMKVFHKFVNKLNATLDTATTTTTANIAADMDF